jgi:uncharacterized protein with HEPN domain
MTNEQQRLCDYLAHILEAIERIEHYVIGNDWPDFYKLVTRAYSAYGQ